MTHLTVIAALAVIATPMQTATPVLVPTTTWSVDQADSQCILSRDFGSRPDRLTLAILTVPGKELADIAVIQPDRAGGSVGSARFAIRIPGMPSIDPRQAVGAPAKEGGRITRGFVMPDQLEKLRDAPVIELTIDRERHALSHAVTAAAFDARTNCEADILRTWGLDPRLVTQVKIRPSPIGDPGNWLSFQDYPTEALRRNEQGTVLFRLDIDISGKIQGCGIIESSGSKALDDAVCRIIPRRARFKPARDAAGEPVPSLFVNRFIFSMPR